MQERGGRLPGGRWGPGVSIGHWESTEPVTGQWCKTTSDREKMSKGKPAISLRGMLKREVFVWLSASSFPVRSVFIHPTWIHLRVWGGKKRHDWVIFILPLSSDTEGSSCLMNEKFPHGFLLQLQSWFPSTFLALAGLIWATGNSAKGEQGTEKGEKPWLTPEGRFASPCSSHLGAGKGPSYRLAVETCDV